MQKGKIALPHNRCCDHSYLSFGGGMAAEPPSPLLILPPCFESSTLAGTEPMQAGHCILYWCALK